MNRLPKIKGFLTIKDIDKETNKIISTNTFEDKNVFLNQGYREFIRAVSVSENSTGYQTDQHTINMIKLGEDVGGGDLLNPDPAEKTFTENNQEPVYVIVTENAPQNSLSSPANTTNLIVNEDPTSDDFVQRVRFEILLDGDDVLDDFPDQVDLQYTSTALYTDMGAAVAFRRFPARSINRLIDVSITWDLFFDFSN